MVVFASASATHWHFYALVLAVEVGLNQIINLQISPPSSQTTHRHFYALVVEVEWRGDGCGAGGHVEQSSASHGAQGDRTGRRTDHARILRHLKLTAEHAQSVLRHLAWLEIHGGNYLKLTLPPTRHMGINTLNSDFVTRFL
jgi:hypothetical protein